MFIWIFLSSVFLISAIIFVFWVKPQKDIARYKQEFQKMGYKPYIYKFHPFQVASLAVIKQAQKKGDSLYYHKNVFQGYDLMIGNNINNVSIQFLSPQLMKQMCEHDRDWHYEKDKITFSIIDRILGKGILSSQGQVWKKKRKTLNQVFNYNFISRQVPTIIKCLNEAFDEAEKGVQKGEQMRIHMKSFALNFTSKFIFYGFLGGDINKEKINGQNPADILSTMIDCGMEQFHDVVSMMFGPKFLDLGLRAKDKVNNQRIRIFDAWAKDYVQKRMKTEKQRITKEGDNYRPVDITSAITYQSVINQKDGYTYDQIVAQFKTFFMAAIQTTSSLILSLVFYAHKYPQVYNNLKAQIDEKVKEQEINYENIKNMQWLQAMQSESNRMMGPAIGIFPRTAVVDHQFGGVKIHKGVHAHYYSVAAQYSEKYYKQPMKYRPERWINGECQNNHPYALMGFHGGPRGCIGKHIGLLESKLALIYFIRRYNNAKMSIDRLQGKMGLVHWAKDFDLIVVKGE